jgi:hypothetical protein
VKGRERPHGPEQRPRPRLRPGRAFPSHGKAGWAANARGWARLPPRPDRQRQLGRLLSRPCGLSHTGRSGPKWSNFFSGICFSISRNQKQYKKIRKIVKKIQKYLFSYRKLQKYLWTNLLRCVLWYFIQYFMQFFS